RRTYPLVGGHDPVATERVVLPRYAAVPGWPGCHLRPTVEPRCHLARAAPLLRAGHRGEVRIAIAPDPQRTTILHHAVEHQWGHQVDLQQVARTGDPVGDPVATGDAAVTRVHPQLQVVVGHVPPGASRG